MNKANEAKLRKKITNVFLTYKGRNMEADSNVNSFIDAMLGVAKNAIKTEVNIRLQEARHKKK